MLFNSYEYIFLFLPITIAGFFFLGSRVHHKVAVAWLVGASLFFYGWWNPAYVSLIMGSIIFNYAVGFQLKNSRKAPNFRKGMLIFGIAMNLCLIGYFKYANFFVGNLNFTFGTDFHLKNIILPLAISFFTFQQIAYLVDAYERELHESNLLHYFLFVTFFPQLIAGPIVHHKEMMPQFGKNKLYEPHAINFAMGITTFAIGLFKKIVLADGVAEYASPVFAAAEKGSEIITLFYGWGGTIAYTLQIYFDFSGYTDMAIGSALIVGIKLPLNFNSPYKSLNIIEFWQRWHITLGRFFQEYLFTPLCRTKGGTSRMGTNLIVTMLLGGLWHGAGWTFIIWGGLQGVLLAINHSWRTFRKKVLGQNLKHTSLTGKTISVILTMFAVTIGMVFFRAETIEGATTMLTGMFGLNGASIPSVFTNIHPALTMLLSKLHITGSADSGIVFTTKWVMICFSSIILFFPNSIQYVNSIFANEKLSNGRLFSHAMLTGIMIVWAVIAIDKPSEFLYFQF